MSTIKKEETIEKTVDIIPICNYNGYNYWLEETGLYRLQENNKIDKKSAERIDQVNTKDLSPVEVIYIVETIREQK